jgi:hypothetical protein
LGLLRPYSQAPRDPALSSETFDWQSWVTQTLASLQGSATPIPAPSGVATTGYPNGVQVTWNEIPLNLADRYVIYENTINQSGGTIVGTVPANQGGTINKYFRPGLTDTTTRYYSVQGFSSTTGGATSSAVKGAASLISLNTGTNLDQILDGNSFQRPVIGNTLAPDLPYDGDYEQFPDTAVVADGWTKGFQTNGSITDANYARSSSPFRGTYAQSILSADNVKGTSVASRPFGIKEFLQYQFQVRAKIDVKPENTDSFPGSSLSGSWTIEQGTASVSGNAVGIATGGADSRFLAVRNESYPAEQFAQATCTVAPTGTNTIGVCVRGSAIAETFYAFYCDATDRYLFKVVTGAVTVLAQQAGASMAVNDVLRLEVSGTSLTAKVNGTAVLTATDSAISSGAPGLQGLAGTGVTAKVGSFVAGGGHGFYFRVLWFNNDSDLTIGGFTGLNDIVTGITTAFTVAVNTYQTFTGTVTAPLGARFCRIALYNWGPNKVNIATVITVDTVTVQLQKVNRLSQAGGSTNTPTTTNIVYTDLAEMSLTITTAGEPVFISFSGDFSNDTVTNASFRILKDSAAELWSTNISFPAAGAFVSASLTYIDSPAAGSHTYKIQWATGVVGSTLSRLATFSILQILQMP